MKILCFRWFFVLQLQMRWMFWFYVEISRLENILYTVITPGSFQCWLCSLTVEFCNVYSSLSIHIPWLILVTAVLSPQIRLLYTIKLFLPAILYCILYTLDESKFYSNYINLYRVRGMNVENASWKCSKLCQFT